MKYICKECGATFDYPNEVPHVEWHGGVKEVLTLGYCPECNGEDWETAATCKDCGKQYPSSIDLYHICPECEKDARGKLLEFNQNLSASQREFISDHYLGGWLIGGAEEAEREDHNA